MQTWVTVVKAEPRKWLTPLVLYASLTAFIFLVILPTVFLISFTFTRWSEIYLEVFANPLIGNEHWVQIQKVLAFSFKLSALTVLFDLLFGIPLAYTLSRKRFAGKSLLEDVVTLPLVIPTSGFGFATLITWTTVAGLGGFLGLGSGLIHLGYLIPIVKIPFLMFMVHVGLTLPYVVLTVKAKMDEVNPVYETASRTLGAPSFTTFRKVLLPLAMPGVFSGGVLAFARSLGETGATMVVSGIYTTASIAIVRWVFEFKFAAASFLGCLLILVAWALILPVEFLMGGRLRFKGFKKLELGSGFRRIALRLERAFSRLNIVKDLASLSIIVIAVIIPVLVVLNSIIPYWSKDPYTGKAAGGILYQMFGPPNYFKSLVRATVTSFTVALTATYISTCLAIPLAFIIKKHRFGGLIRSVLKIPLIVPTSALGLSVLLLWGPSGLNLLSPGVWLTVLTHVVFSVPVIVEPTIAAYEGSQIALFEESARTLGATSYDVAETISLPLVKRGVLAGAILSFTHSLGETGATFIVMGKDITVPTLVVNMVEALAIPAALFSSTYLIAISLALLLIFKWISK